MAFEALLLFRDFFAVLAERFGVAFFVETARLDPEAERAERSPPAGADRSRVCPGKITGRRIPLIRITRSLVVE